MKTKFTLAISAALFTSAALNGQGFDIDATFDELGNGFLTNTSGFFQAFPFSVTAEPLSGVTTLEYDLLNPPGLVLGDVLIVEPSTGSLSDILRFSQFNNGSVFVFSDLDPGEPSDSLADVIDLDLIPHQPLTITLTEVGPEQGPNGVDYTPVAGQPGFVAGASGPVHYHFTSDVPEASPSVAAALVLSGAVGFAMRRRFSRASA